MIKGMIRGVMRGVLPMMSAAALLTWSAAQGQITVTPSTAPAPVELGPNNETLVTIHVKDASPEEVFAAVGKQAGLKFQFQPENMWDNVEAAVTVDYDKKPFWQVVHDLCLQWDLAPQNNGVAKRIMLVHNSNSAWSKHPAYVAGPFIVSPESASYSRSIFFGNAERVDTQFNMQFSGMMDPNAKIMSFSNNIDVVEATDDHGNNLAPEQNGQQTYYGGNGNRALFVNFSARLQYPANNAGTKIAKFKGNINALMMAKSEMMTFADLTTANEVSKTAGDFTIVIHSMTMENQGQRATVKVMISGKADDNRNSNYNLMMSGQMVDAKGRGMTNQGMNGGGGANGKQEYILYFGRDNFQPGAGAAPEPAKLSFEVPLETKEVAIPVELSDIKMP